MVQEIDEKIKKQVGKKEKKIAGARGKKVIIRYKNTGYFMIQDGTCRCLQFLIV